MKQVFVAGCGRTATRDAGEQAYAYLDLAFAECPTCPFRIEPEDEDAFCVWRAEGADAPLQAALKQALGDV